MPRWNSTPLWATMGANPAKLTEVKTMIFPLQGRFASRFAAIVATLATLLLPMVAGAAEGPAQNPRHGCRGNLALLLVVDSSAKDSFASLDKTLFSALDHFGMPFEVFDLHRQSLNIETLLSHPAMVIGQNGLGKSFSVRDIDTIQEAVEKGLVNLDGMLSVYPTAYRKMLGVRGEKTAHISSVQIARHTHPITRFYEPGRTYPLRKQIALTSCETAPSAEILLTAEGDRPAVFVLRCGRGKIVQWTLASDFWLPEYFGHAQGLDGLFWRSLAWATRKPWVMMAMPPFVTARIDDASGSGSPFLVNSQSAAIRFRYLDALNQLGYRPNVGLFTDDIPATDGQIIQEKYDRGLAEFSAHAFTEGKFIYIDRVFQGNEYRMVEYEPAQLRQFFAKLDRQFAGWGIKPSKTVNSHCFNPGLNALPFLKERGETFVMFAGKFGTDYADSAAYRWNPGPYGHAGFTFDRMPDHPEFFNVEAHPYIVSADGKISDGDIDILHRNTVFRNEGTATHIEPAARKGAEAITLGLDGLFFGCLFTHEQRIASLRVDEWEAILRSIDQQIARYPKIFQTYDYVAEYAKSRYDTKITEARYDSASHNIRLKVSGKSTLPLKVYLFGEQGPDYRFREIPVLAGEREVVWKENE
jgi:hypothetical protein